MAVRGTANIFSGEEHMPIYEYRCKDCQQIFEEWSKHIDDQKKDHNCPICRGPAERLVSQTSFALKGNGWYVTEYGSHKGKTEDAPSRKTEEASACAGECKAPCKAEGSAESASASTSPAAS